MMWISKGNIMTSIFKVLLLFLSLIQTIFAQSLEPRLYSNIPTDSNFLLVGYAYSNGALPSNSALKDPQLSQIL